MIRILITGATGFVGRQIIRALDVDGISLLPVVRSGKEGLLGNIQNIEKVITSFDLFSEDESWWESHCDGIDIVVHAAWFAKPMEYQHSPLNFDCLIGSLKLARGAAKAGVKRFIGIGTCAEYDQNQGILSIDSAIKPKTPYAAAKTSLFFALSQWLPAQSISFAWCRLFYLYGEGEDGQRLVPYIRTKLALGEIAELTSGKQIRDYIDVAEAGKKIANVVSDESYQGPINICSGVPVTVRQLAEKIADEFGRRDLLRFDVRPDNIFDPHCVIGR